MARDQVKIYNRTMGVVKLARTGKKEISVPSRQDILVRLNEIEDDERLQESIKQELARGTIDVTVDNITDGTIPSLTNEQVITVYDSERIFAVTDFPLDVAPGQIILRIDLNQLYWWNGTIWQGVGGGGGGGSAVSYLASFNKGVPKAGTKYGFVGNVATSSAPIVFDVTGTIVYGSVSVNKIDTARAYRLQYLLNGAVVEFIDLPTSTLKLTKLTFSTAIVVGDELSIRMILQSGSGKSTFKECVIALTVTLL